MARSKVRLTGSHGILSLLIVLLIFAVKLYLAHRTDSASAPPPSSHTVTLGNIAARSKTAGCQINGALPDGACTPGAAISSATASQICVSGYSSGVRNVTETEKQAVFAEYGIAQHAAGEYEVDHYISLELGGSNDISNLWPEAARPTPGFHEKDAVENWLHEQVCSGKLNLPAAQLDVISDWTVMYRQISGS